MCVLEPLEKNTKGEVQAGSKAMFVEEYSAMKLLASPRSGDDNNFVVAGGPAQGTSTARVVLPNRTPSPCAHCDGTRDGRV